MTNASCLRRVLPLLLLTAPLCASGQQAKAAAKPATGDTALLRLFDKPAEVQWVRYYRGRLDDVAEVNLRLGYDGKNCRGFLFYTRSKTRLRLEGTLEGKTLQLEERDDFGEKSGALTGTLEGKKLQAEWTNFNNTLGSRLDAEEMQPSRSTPAHCGDNKWTNRFSGKWNGGDVDMILSRSNNGALYGYLWVESDNRTYPLKGQLDADDTYNLDALLPEGRTAAKLQGSLKQPPVTDCAWTGSGEKRALHLTRQQSLVTGCYEYADYRSSYDVTYPRTTCEPCNKWLDDMVKAWVNRCQDVQAAQQGPQQPSQRNSLRASGWTEIVCWNDRLLCGYLGFADSWSSQCQGAAFNFDLKEGREITFNDLFTKGFDAQKWFDNYIKKETPKLPRYADDPEFRNWLDRYGFPIITFRREGVVLSTQFHPLYNRQNLVVPYTTLKPYMKKATPVADFVP